MTNLAVLLVLLHTFRRHRWWRPRAHDNRNLLALFTSHLPVGNAINRRRLIRGGKHKVGVLSLAIPESSGPNSWSHWSLVSLNLPRALRQSTTRHGPAHSSCMATPAATRRRGE